MQSGEPGAPWIGQRASALRTQLEQVRMPQRDGFLTRSIVTAQDKLYVHRIAMAQGDGRLQPLELHLPSAPERVRPGFELPEILHDDESLTFWNPSGQPDPFGFRSVWYGLAQPVDVS